MFIIPELPNLSQSCKGLSFLQGSIKGSWPQHFLSRYVAFPCSTPQVHHDACGTLAEGGASCLHRCIIRVSKNIAGCLSSICLEWFFIPPKSSLQLISEERNKGLLNGTKKSKYSCIILVFTSWYLYNHIVGLLPFDMMHSGSALWLRCPLQTLSCSSPNKPAILLLLRKHCDTCEGINCSLAIDILF